MQSTVRWLCIFFQENNMIEFGALLFSAFILFMFGISFLSLAVISIVMVLSFILISTLSIFFKFGFWILLALILYYCFFKKN